MKTLTVILGLLISISLSAAADEAAMLKAVRNFDTDIEINTDALIFYKAVDLDGGYTVAAFYEDVSEEYENTTYMFLLKKSGSSYRVLELFDEFTTYSRYYEPIDFLENTGEPGRRFFAYGYGGDLAGGRSIDFEYYILYRVKENTAECLFVGYTDVQDSYHVIESDLRDIWTWRGSTTYKYSYEYRFIDIGDEVPLLLHSEYCKGPEDKAPRLIAVRLFRYKAERFTPEEEPSFYADHFIEGAGAYVEVPETLYSDILAGMDDDKVEFLLAERARRFGYDVPKAIGLYEEAIGATDDGRVKAGAAAEIDELSFYKDDPKEAVILFDSCPYYGDDRYDKLFESYPESRVAALARFNLGGIGNYYDFIRDYPESPHWPYAVVDLCWVAVTKGAGGISPKEIEPYVLKALEEEDVPNDYKVLTCVQFGQWAEAGDDYDLALEYYQKGYEASRDDYFRKCCAGTIALLYDKTGDRKKAFTTAVGISGYGEYSMFSYGLDPIVGAYEVVDGGDTLTISELAGDEEMHFETVQFNGEGEDEILIWKAERYPPRYIWAKILEFQGDRLRVVNTIPGGFYTLEIDAGLDMKPNVFTETVDATSSEPSSYSTMYGFYEGEYRELGKFYLGVYPRLTTPDEQHIIELEIPVYDKGRVVNVGEYVGDPDTWEYFDETDSYIFDEERAYFIKVDR